MLVKKKIQIVINARLYTLAASVEFCNSEYSLNIDPPADVVLPAIYGVSLKTHTTVFNISVVSPIWWLLSTLKPTCSGVSVLYPRRHVRAVISASHCCRSIHKTVQGHFV